MCDYEKFNRMNVDELALIIKDTGGMTTRNIDLLLYCNSDGINNVETEHHILHEQKILEILTKFRPDDLKRLFNDPRVTYPYREYLNGVTGSMSALLVDSKFITFNYLLKIGLEINYNADLYILVGKLFLSNVNYDNYGMPVEEFKAYKNIIKNLRKKARMHDLFNPDWWDTFQSNLNGLISSLGHNDWWISNVQNMYHKMFTYLEIKPWRDNTLIEGWESTPVYNDYKDLQHTPQNFFAIKKIFIPSNSNHSNYSNSNKMMGGYIQKYLKYKQKYIELKQSLLL